MLGLKKKGRKKVELFREELGKLDMKIGNPFSTVYNTLHLDMGYNGLLIAKIVAVGLDEVET